MLCFLGLGSNKSLGALDCRLLLARACVMLKAFFSDFAFSSVYCTKPMYFEHQEDFYNMVVCGRTFLSPHELLREIHKIEACLGRNREKEIRNGPRTIDIDIELYGNEEIHFLSSSNPMENLEVPHPKIAERAFVLVPLLEVLRSNAEIKKRDFFQKSLADIGNQGVEICLEAQCFAKLIAETEARYGRTSCHSDSGKSKSV
ncbi:MAG: 2-amino-4-hydroxy-6-hydroxymethyldihydropteridine diphosphokinase [Treponema sp.]|nr:2-amino-4-hydroxy-6-hydroxymethyldihydropteridine diphosphokinase [Treponema sp.]